MFIINFTIEAIEDLRQFRKNERQRIITQIEVQLKQQPHNETRNRKRLRPNQAAEWELRIGNFRVFYDVDISSNSVKIEAVGYKQGSRLFLRGEEYEL